MRPARPDILAACGRARRCPSQPDGPPPGRYLPQLPQAVHAVVRPRGGAGASSPAPSPVPPARAGRLRRCPRTAPMIAARPLAPSWQKGRMRRAAAHPVARWSSGLASRSAMSGPGRARASWTSSTRRRPPKGQTQALCGVVGAPPRFSPGPARARRPAPGHPARRGACDPTRCSRPPGRWCDHRFRTGADRASPPGPRSRTAR